MIESNVTVAANMKLDEEELRALDALAGYGADSFLKVFYKHMGSHYMRPHETGLRRLFKKIRREVPEALSKADMARKFLSERP